MSQQPLQVTFSLLDLESGMRDHVTNYVLKDMFVTSDDNLRIAFSTEDSGSTNVGTFYFFIHLSKINALLTLIDRVFFSKGPIKLDVSPWITFYFQGKREEERDIIYQCRLVAGIQEKDNIELLLKWAFYAVDENVASEEIDAVLKSDEMKNLEKSLVSLKTVEPETLANMATDPKVGSFLERIGASGDFDPRHIAMEGLGYKQHGDYILQEIKKNYIIVLAMKASDAKNLAEQAGMMVKDKKK